MNLDAMGNTWRNIFAIMFIKSKDNTCFSLFALLANCN